MANKTTNYTLRNTTHKRSHYMNRGKAYTTAEEITAEVRWRTERPESSSSTTTTINQSNTDTTYSLNTVVRAT